MPTGTIVSVYRDDTSAYAAVSVVEGSRTFEYIGVVPLTGDLAAFGFPGQDWSALSNANKKLALQAAVKAERDRQRAAPTPVAGISGTVTL